MRNHLRYDATLDEVSDSWYRVPHDFRDWGEIEHWSGCLADVAGAESKKQLVVDELLFLDHAQFLRREPCFHVKLSNPQALVFDDFWHKLNKKWWFSNKIAWKSIKATFLKIPKRIFVGDRGTPLWECGLSGGARIARNYRLRLQIMSEQVWQKSPKNDWFTEKSKKLRFKFKSLNKI